jgi:outer membrane immunogenic protein
MKYFLAGIIALLALASVNAARAADMSLKAPPPAPTPASSWTGFYLGGQLGYDYSRSPSTYTLDPANPFLAGLFVPAVTTGTLASSTSQSSGGFLGGVTAGYNIQTGIVVWGVEADFDGVGNQHTSSVAPTPALAFPTLTTRTNTQTDWLATVRGRLGVTVFPDTLIFGTGGLAVGRIAESTSIIPSGAGSTCATDLFCSIGSATSVRSGWTAGGGIEHMFAAHLTAKIEYLYYNLGSMNYIATEQAPFTGLVGAPDVDVHTSLTAQMVRAGINYKF